MTTLAPNLTFMPTDHDFMELVWENGQIVIRGRGGRGRGRGGRPSDGNTKSSSITTPSSTTISSAHTCKLQENTKNIERFQTMEYINHPLDISLQEYCDYSPDLCDQANLNAPRSVRNDIAETEKFKSSNHKMSAVGRINPVESTVLIDDSAGGGSESVVIGLKKSQPAALMAAKVYSRPPLADILEDNPLSDDQRSKVVVCQEDAIRNNISPNRATLGFTVIEGKPNTQQTTIDPTDSSVCSHGASNAPNYTTKGKHQQQTKDSEYHAGEYCEEERPEHAKMKKTISARGSTYAKRNREHNLSERRRRDKINKKMRTLQDLIPNCSKGDKASVLDEAIDYLKTLQLQLQIMSMGSGMYMAPPMMMLPLGMHLAHCSPMVTAGTGMGMGMGHHLHNQNQWPISQSLPRGPHQV